MGEITGAFGVKGWVKVHSLTDPRENVLAYSPWLLRNHNKTKEYSVIDGRRQGKTVVARLESISDRDTAAAYCGWEILIKKSQLPATEAGEFYWADLVGVRVTTEAGVVLGVVDYLIETGANDVLVVKDDNKEYLIPFLLERTVKKIDLEQQLMVVDWNPNF